jgi:hypothetical protein
MIMISGYKTYIAAFLLAMFAISGFFTGSLEDMEVFKLLVEALAIAGLRHGIAKLQ